MGTVRSVAGARGVFGARNFMTPNIIGYYQCGDYLVECMLELEALPETVEESNDL